MNPRSATVILVVLCLSAFSKAWCQAVPGVRHGEIDLTHWNPNSNPTLSLDGQWEFYWEQLLTSRPPDDEEVLYAQLSLPWNEQRIGEQEFPMNGYATYVLTIFLPTKTKDISFSVPAVFNSYAFYVNNKLYTKVGRVGTTEKETIPVWRPSMVTVKDPSDTLTIAFQIANFQNTRGGCAELMRIGRTDYLTNMDSIFHMSGISLMVFFTITSLIGFVAYFMFRASTFLYFSFVSLAFVFRFAFSDLYLYEDLGMSLPWIVAAKIEYLTIPALIVAAALFIESLYPNEFHRVALYTLLILNALLSTILIIGPSSLFSPLLVVMQIEALVFILYVIYVVIRALIFQRDGAWITAIGLLIFALVAFYNVYTLLNVSDLNRTSIHIGYGIALILNLVSLFYRTPMRINKEERDTLRYTDLYN